MGYPHPSMYMGYGMDMGPYRGRGRGPMPMAPGRFAPPAYGYGYGYGYFPPAFPPHFAGRLPPQGNHMGGRGFIAERRPPPGTPGVSSGLQVSTASCQRQFQVIWLDVVCLLLLYVLRRLNSLMCHLEPCVLPLRPSFQSLEHLLLISTVEGNITVHMCKLSCHTRPANAVTEW